MQPKTITIQITPIGQCNYMYPNSDNIIWFLQKYAYIPEIKIKNIIQVIYNFPGDNIVLGYAILEYIYDNKNIHEKSFISNLIFQPKKYFFSKDIWELSIYELQTDPRLGSFSSIKTFFISETQSFLDIFEEDKDNNSINTYLPRAKEEYRDLITSKVVAFFSLN